MLFPDSGLCNGKAFSNKDLWLSIHGYCGFYFCKWILPIGIAMVKANGFYILLDPSSLISKNVVPIYILTGNIRQLFFSYLLPATRWNQPLTFVRWMGKNFISLLF